MGLIDQTTYRSHPGLNQSLLKYISEPGVFKAKQAANANKETDDEEVLEKENIVMGSFLDDILLDYDLIGTKYVVTDDFVVSEAIGEIVQAVYSTIKQSGTLVSDNIIDYKDTIPGAAKIANRYLTYKADTVINKVVEEGAGYFNFLCKKGNKIPISENNYQLMLFHYNQLKTMFVPSDDMIEVRPKVCLESDFNGVLLKSELDYLIINHRDKTFKVIDLKTTTDLLSFQKSIWKYRYDFQMAFYNFMVTLNLSELGISDYVQLPAEWVCVSNSAKLPVRKTTCMVNSLKSFKSFDRKYLGVLEAIDLYKWHLEQEKWEYPKHIYVNGTDYFNPTVVYE
jgi:hypothetical protein